MTSIFRDASFATEVEDWLQNRANPQEKERYNKFAALVKQAATARAPHAAADASTSLPSHAHSRPRRQSAPAARVSTQSCSSSSSETPHADVRPASACPGGWLHTATIHNSSRVLNPCRTTSAAAAAAAGAGSSSLRARPHSSMATAHSSSKTTVTALLNPALHGLSLKTPNPMRGCMELLRPLSSAAAALAASDTAAADTSPNRHKFGTSHTSSTSSGTSDPLAVTTTMAAHGLKELYPDLWHSTLPICRPEAAPNKNFISEWGQALQQGAGEAWKPYLASTYQVANDQVHKPVSCGSQNLCSACCFTPAPAGGHPSSSTCNRAGTWSAYSLVIWLAIWRTAERLHI